MRTLTEGSCEPWAVCSRGPASSPTWNYWLSSYPKSIQKGPDLPERVKPPNCQCLGRTARGHTKEAATSLTLNKALHTISGQGP